MLICLLVVDAGGVFEAAARSRYVRRSRRLARGVRLVRIIDRRGPKRIKVLKVDPGLQPTLDVALANGAIPGHERTSSMARRHHALAAINGDFTVRPTLRGAGRPVNTFAVDGVLATSPLIWGRNFAISKDETRTYVGHAPLGTLLVQRDARALEIRGWNTWQGERGPYAYTRSGGRAFRPPLRSCSARLVPTGDRVWRPRRPGVRRRYTVEVVRCSYRRLWRKNGMVIAARRGTTAARTISSTLRPGEVVNVTWFLERWAGILDTVGGNPTLLERGRVSIGRCTSSYFCRRNPRTGIGVTPSGKLLLVTVDGRSRRSVGIKLGGFAHLFSRLGAEWALNLDGGGSTTMVIRGRVVNNPSDPGGERAVGSAVLVLGRKDRGERRRLEPASLESLSTSGDMSPRSAALEVFDPGSTGGMLDAMVRGDLGRRQPLTPVLSRVLTTYRRHADQARVLSSNARFTRSRKGP